MPGGECQDPQYNSGALRESNEGISSAIRHRAGSDNSSPWCGSYLYSPVTQPSQISGLRLRGKLMMSRK